MSEYRLGVVGLSLLGIYFLVWGLLTAAAFSVMFFQMVSASAYLGFLTPVVYLAAGIVLLRFRHGLASRLFGDKDSAEGPETPMPASGFLAVGFAVLGAYLLVEYLKAGTQLAIDPIIYGLDTRVADLSSTGVALLCGLVLFFLGPRLAAYWEGNRSAGESPVQPLRRWLRAGTGSARAVVVCGLLVAALMCLYPPWIRFWDGTEGWYAESAGYSPVFLPPARESAEGDVGTIRIAWDSLIFQLMAVIAVTVAVGVGLSGGDSSPDEPTSVAQGQRGEAGIPASRRIT